MNYLLTKIIFVSLLIVQNIESGIVEGMQKLIDGQQVLIKNFKTYDF